MCRTTLAAAYVAAVGVILSTVFCYGAFCYAVQPVKISPNAQKGKRSRNLHTHSETEFRIDKGLTASLYDEVLREARGEANSKLIMSSLIPQFSLVKPRLLRLTNDYFSVPYEEKIHSLPLFVINFVTKQPLLFWDPLAVFAEASLGYAYTEGLYTLESKSGLELKDSVHLHWLPVSVALRLAPKALAFQPSLKFGLGGQYFSQNNQIDGMQHALWLPLAQIAASFVLFDNDGAEQANFFQGLRLGASLLRSFYTAQSVQGWSLDVGTQILL